MKFNKFFKISLGAIILLPLSFFVGNEMLANNLTERFGYEISNNNLIACGGGGGGGSSPAAKKAAKEKKTKAKLSFKKRQLSKMAAAGEDTSKLEAQIAELEALLTKQKRIYSWIIQKQLLKSFKTYF